MKQVFTHIGQHKTGSSALQEFFHLNRKTLLQQGLLYPRTGRVDIQGAPHTRHMKLSLQPLVDPSLIPDLVREINESGAQRVVISGEGFCRASARPQLRHGVEHLAKALERFDARIVVYLRPQEELVQSLYNWRIKFGVETRTFQDYLHAHLRDNPEYFHYDSLLEPFEAVFGPERIIVRIYDKNSFMEGSLFKDFFHAIGAEWRDGYKVPPPDVNGGVPPKTLEVMRRLNALSETRLESSTQLSHHIAEIIENEDEGEPHAMLTFEQKCAIREAYAESNARVAARYQPQLDGRLFPDVKHSPYAPPEQVMHVEPAEFDALVLGLWDRMLNLYAEVARLVEQYKQSRDAFVELEKRTVELARKLRAS
jgi:hypothetical protein